MLSSTIDYLRRAIAAHPNFNPKDIYGNYTIENCSPATLKALALKLGISFHDSDRRGRPPRKPYPPSIVNPTPAPTPYNEPTKDPTPVNGGALEAIIRGIVLDVMSANPATLDETQIIDLIVKHKGTVIERPLTIYANPEASEPLAKFNDGDYHYKLPLIITALKLKLNVYLVGPAGSGKTTIGEQAAKALGVPFYGFGAMTSEYKMVGFTDAQGKVVHTQFRKAYTEGGCVCLDEIDAYSAPALLALNSALANGWCEFAGGMERRHPDFYCIAGGNTTGTGQSRLYVGRQQQDAAALDRFQMIDLPYDPHLEAKMIGADCSEPKITYEITPREMTSTQANMILRAIHAVRLAIDAHSIKHVVSPRASVACCKLYGAGWPVADIVEACIWKGLDKQSRQLIANNSIVASALASFI